MILAGLFAGALCVGLIVGDWLYFVRLTPDAIRYGCRVARTQDRFTRSTVASIGRKFSPDGVLRLPHGLARFYPDQAQIAIRPQYQLFSMSFRTAWPLKGLIHLSPDGDALDLLCVKRIPWSSAVVTLIWFGIVSMGSLGFLVTYGVQGGFSTFSGVLMGTGITGIGLLVLAFGLVTVMFSYRLENGRLSQVYEELREMLEG
jgi:hypothetical protein